MNFTDLDNRQAIISRVPKKYQSLPYVYIAQAEFEADEKVGYKFGISMNRQNRGRKQSKTNFSTRVCQTAQGLKPCWVYFLIFYEYENLPSAFSKGKDGKRYVVHFIESAIKYYLLKDKALLYIKRPTRTNPNSIALGEFIVNKNYKYVADLVFNLFRTPNDNKFHGTPEKWNTGRSTDTISDNLNLPTPIFVLKMTNKSIFAIEPQQNNDTINSVLGGSFFEAEPVDEGGTFSFVRKGYISQRLPEGYELGVDIDNSDEKNVMRDERRFNKGQFVVLQLTKMTKDNYRGIELKDWFDIFQIAGKKGGDKLALILYKAKPKAQSTKKDLVKGILDGKYLPVWRSASSNEEVQSEDKPPNFDAVERTGSKEDVLSISVSRNKNNELIKSTQHAIQTAFYNAKINAHNDAKQGGNVFDENEDILSLFDGDILMEGFQSSQKSQTVQKMVIPSIPQYNLGNDSVIESKISTTEDDTATKDDAIDDRILRYYELPPYDTDDLSTTDDELPPKKKVRFQFQDY